MRYPATSRNDNYKAFTQNREDFVPLYDPVMQRLPNVNPYQNQVGHE